MAMEITMDNFEQEVLNSDVPVMIDFWATWCMPCKMLAPVIEELAEEANGAYKVGKIDVDRSQSGSPVRCNEHSYCNRI